MKAPFSFKNMVLHNHEEGIIDPVVCRKRRQHTDQGPLYTSSYNKVDVKTLTEAIHYKKLADGFSICFLRKRELLFSIYEFTI